MDTVSEEVNGETTNISEVTTAAPELVQPVETPSDPQPGIQSDDNAQEPISEEPESIDDESSKETVEQVAAKKRKQPEKEPEWFDIDDSHNTQVYVSNLPLDTTEEEFITLMKKYGYLLKDPDTNDWKIKMYKDREGNFKGDALCGYLKRESVDLAIQLLDESMVKNNVIHVEKAKFTLKGQYDPTKKPKRSNKSKKKIQKSAER